MANLIHDDLGLRSILKVSVEIVEAQHGYLLWEENGQWLVIAHVEIDEDPEVMQPTRLETMETVPTGIVHHVASTKESLVLNDVAHEGRFGNDPTIQKNHSKSILCAPSLFEGKVNGVVYLENKLEIGAFTPDRVKIINLLTSQIALTVKNAQLHATLARSEAHFRTTFYQAAIGIAHVSLKGELLRINQKFCNILGYSESELLRFSFQDITHPDDLDADLASLRLLLNRGIDTYSRDKRYIRKDGSIVWTNLTVSTVLDREGNPDYFVSVIMDISERKHVEKDLTESHDFFTHLISAVPDAIFSIKMPERTIMWANDSFDVMGYDDEEYIGQSTKSYYADPEDYRRVGLLQKEAIRKGENYIRTEFMVVHKRGEIVPVELTATYYRVGGQVSRITAMVRDITDRKQAEAKLIESERRYRNLVDNSMVGVFHLKVDGRFLFVNKVMAKMFDFDTPEQMISLKPTKIYREPKEHERLLTELHEFGTVTSFEVEAVSHADRYLHVLFSARLIGDEIFGMVMDITERKKAEQKLVDSQQRLKSLASRLTIVEEKERRLIAAGLHDHVGQSLALARMQIASTSTTTADSQMKEQLDDISKTLLRTLEDTQMLILELSSPAMHDIGLSAAISDWLSSHVEAKYNLECNVIDDVDSDLRKTLDPNVRSILFRNVRELVVNVVKHAHATMVNIRLEIREQKLDIIVEDDGIGLDRHEIKQASRQSGGFGLFSVEELMSDLSGSLKIESEPGKGCTAILSAPFPAANRVERDNLGI